MSAPVHPDVAPLLDMLTTGLALVDAGSFEVVYTNRQFDVWFPDPGLGGRALAGRLTTLPLGELASGAPLSFEAEVKVGRRHVSVAVSIRPRADGDGLVVECTDVSRRRQLEHMLHSYSSMVERKARDLQNEKDRVEKLLLNVMPRSVYRELRDYGITAPQMFEDASVLMLDFVGSTEMDIADDPGRLIAELNDMFTAFDRITEQFGCERIRTIGDAYMAVSGVPEPTPDHARNIARAALLMRRYVEKRNAAHQTTWQCRIGINAGPVIGSIVGVQKYLYDVFGPGVNLAARMEQVSAPMEIMLCEAMVARLGDSVVVESVGEQDIKGFGRREVYRLIAMSGESAELLFE